MKTAASILTVALPLQILSAAVPPPPAPVPPPPPAPVDPPGKAIAAAGKFAVPVAAISAAEKADFAEGKIEFLNVEDAASGLGPIFNDVSCVACHFQGGAGGFSRVTVTRFGRVVNGVFDPLESLGGSLLQRRAIAPEFLERIPREANVVALRMTTPLFGAGLIEAIPDAVIQANAAAPKKDGIAGKVSMITDPVSGQQRVGRFGWKAQQATLLGFSADAYLNEMGITNRFFPTENAPNGNKALLAKADKVLDPEDSVTSGKSDIDRAADYMRMLAPVPRAPKTKNSDLGEQVFAQVGCAQCHTPAMTTGPSVVSALSGKTAALYSDLLLHDMGALGDGIAQGAAGMREMRTAPLWGLRLRDRYLHDGRASSLDLAILAHDGEGRAVRDRYAKLPPAQRAALMEFLGTL